MYKIISILFLAVLVSAISSTAEAAVKPAAGQLDIIFKKGVHQDDAEEMVEKYGLESEYEPRSRIWRKRPHIVVFVPKGQEKQWQAKLSKDENVERVEFRDIYTHITPHYDAYSE